MEGFRISLPRSGSIPACAGEPSPSAQSKPTPSVYPRVCGGTEVNRQSRRHKRGLSPRVRGNPGRVSCLLRGRGSIPACAGEPKRPRTAFCAVSVYPRVCGGTQNATRGARRARGLSRVCGGTPDGITGRDAFDGLSPRVRGNPAYSGQRAANRGSIPACAGDPIPAAYQRPIPGLSPRVRGNPLRQQLLRSPQRSIPACAGEPRRIITDGWQSGVYPRVCGGTPAGGNLHLQREGLSPRVRGNPEQTAFRTLRQRSIPACAGEPHHPAGTVMTCTVYPRVCGGTRLAAAVECLRPGLSPRVRGNLVS